MTLTMVMGFFAYSLYVGNVISPLLYLSLAVCGISIGIAKAGNRDFALTTFYVGSLIILFAVGLPSAGQASGFFTECVFIFSLAPVVWWLCFAERRGRILMIAGCLLSIVALGLLTQQVATASALPDNYLTYALLLSCVIMVVGLAICYGFELAIYRYDLLRSDVLSEQEKLTLENENKARDLSMEVRSHRATLEHLSRSESRYRSLIEHAFEGILIFDVTKGRVLEVNRRLLSRLGYSLVELRNSNVLFSSPVCQLAGNTAVGHEGTLVTDEFGEFSSYEWSFQTKQGELVDFEISSFRLPAEPHIRVSVFHDLTERKIAQQTLTNVNRELSTFAHAASHDLKEPLRTMSNFASLLNRKYGAQFDDAAKEYIHFIMEAGQRGIRLVGDLLAYAEIGTGEVEVSAVDVEAIAHEVRQTVATRLKEDGAVLVIESLPTVIATHTWVVQLLQNLISNALKFKREGVQPEVRLYSKTSELGYEIFVQDNGIGIAPEHLDTVFGVFQRLVLRDDYEGNGIGLALCKRIMEKLKGDIRVQSKVGEGSTFVLWFPSMKYAVARQPELALN